MWFSKLGPRIEHSVSDGFHIFPFVSICFHMLNPTCPYDLAHGKNSHGLPVAKIHPAEGAGGCWMNTTKFWKTLVSRDCGFLPWGFLWITACRMTDVFLLCKSESHGTSEFPTGWMGLDAFMIWSLIDPFFGGSLLINASIDYPLENLYTAIFMCRMHWNNLVQFVWNRNHGARSPVEFEAIAS